MYDSLFKVNSLIKNKEHQYMVNLHSHKYFHDSYISYRFRQRKEKAHSCQSPYFIM